MRLAQINYPSGTDIDSVINHLNNRERTLLQVPLSELSINPENAALEFGDNSFAMTQHAAKQLAIKLKITPGYVLKISNDLAARNYNDFLQNASGNVQLVIEDGNTIAGVLKEKTAPIDPALLIDVIQDRFRDGDLSVGRWWFNGEGITFRIDSEKFEFEAKVGDMVRAGVDIMIRENSEATLGMRGILFRLSCLNGAVAQETVDLKRQIIKEGWRDQTSRLAIAAEAIDYNLNAISDLSNNLKKMATMELSLPSESKDRAAYIKEGLSGITPRNLSSKGFSETISEATYQEDPTLFGIYNAITRIGRDSLDSRLKEVFERGGFSIATDPDFVMENFINAGDKW